MTGALRCWKAPNQCPPWKAKGLLFWRLSLYDEQATMKVTTCNKHNLTWPKHKGTHDICWKFRTLVNLLMLVAHSASIIFYLSSLGTESFAHPPALIGFVEGISFKNLPKWWQILTWVQKYHLSDKLCIKKTTFKGANILQLWTLLDNSCWQWFPETNNSTQSIHHTKTLGDCTNWMFPHSKFLIH